MNELEKKLLNEESGGVEPQVCIRSKTRIDTGRWWWRTPVWLCVVGQELLMLAVSRRRYAARVSLALCPSSHYCHTTGELVIEPSEDLAYSRFRLTPRDALDLLKAMGIPQWEPGMFQEAAPAAGNVESSEETNDEQVFEADESGEVDQAELNNNLNLTE